MVATNATKQAAGAKDESDEDPGAATTMTRLIHDLYAADGSYTAVRGGRDSDLIIWSEMLNAARRREPAA